MALPAPTAKLISVWEAVLLLKYEVLPGVIWAFLSLLFGVEL